MENDILIQVFDGYGHTVTEHIDEAGKKNARWFAMSVLQNMSHAPLKQGSSYARLTAPTV